MTDVVVPAAFDLFLKEASAKFDQDETADVIHELKRLYSTKRGSFDQNDLYGALKQLYRLGAIDDNGDTKILEIMAEKSSKKEEVLKLISDHRESASPCADFVGRDADVKEILKRVTNLGVPGINLFGESGVGKTTLAKEVSKEMKDLEKVIFIDLRDIKAIDNVYSIVLSKLNLPSWDNSKDRIFKHFEDLTTKTVVILDNIEQLLSRESQAELETRSEFLKFLKNIIVSEASKTENLRMFLTSRIQINELTLKHSKFSEYEVKSFSKTDSKDFITRRVKDAVLDNEQVDGLVKISDLCHGMPYLLRGAEQLKRENYSSSVQVLKKITTQIEKGVPQKFACISASFDSLPSDHLKQVAVKISLLRRPFSVSTAMKIAKLPSDYDAQWDLELLVIHKIITAEDVKGKRKYDLHALFREFVTSYLCKESSVYEEQLKMGKKQFFEHFSGKLTKIAQNFETEFVKTYSKLEVNRPNFVLTLELSEKNKETFDQLLHTDDHNQFVLMGILFEALKDEKERRELFGKWADAAEKQGQWLISALMRSWQSIQGSNLEGTLNEELLAKAKASIEKAKSTTSPEKLVEVNSLLFFCQGKINYMRSKKLTAGQRKYAKKLLQQGIDDLNKAISMRQELGDSTLTARALNLIGNCYMDLENPLTAKTYYQGAMEMMKRLVGSEKHWDFPTYYNQMAQVHDMLGREEEEKWYNRFFGSKKKARQEYEEAVEWMKKALAWQEELGVSDTVNTAIFQRNLANILIGLGKYDQAFESAKKSYEIRQYLLGEHPETVMILYLIGVIHEWRKDHKAALQSYEEAFEMEESLPDGNHSVVRKLLCDRLEAMCKKLNKKDKLKEYRPRIKVIKEAKDASSTAEHLRGVSDPGHPCPFLLDDDENDIHIIADKTGRTYDLLRGSIVLEVPPNAVTKPTKITCKVRTKDYLTTPTGNEETLISHIVELGPKDTDIRQPITVTLMHSGPSRDLGYETVVKALDQDVGVWKELEVNGQDRILCIEEHCQSIQVKLKKLTSLAVVSRLITDRFEVTPKGCVVRSSVCDDVTVEFPEGAVDKTVNGTMKLLAIPKNFFQDWNDVYPCPVLLIHGLEDCVFLECVRVRIPHPCLEDYPEKGNVRLFFRKDDKWEDITDGTECSVYNSCVEFKVKHFSIFWVLFITASSTAFVTGVMVGRMYDRVVKMRKGLVFPSLRLSHNQKRWLVIGICLNTILLPTLRDFIKPEMDKHYDDLKTYHNIDKQSDASHLKKDGKHHLNYGSLNNNSEKKKKKDYDYEVKSGVDLAKLYLKPYMAHFTGFDATCDMSAVLGILSSASVFPADIQNLAGKIRQEVRNEWAHCNFLDWNKTKFKTCFQLMDSLLRALKLPSDVEQRTANELKDWETKGVAYCIGNPDDATSLIELGEIYRLSQEVQRLEQEEAERPRSL